MNNKFDFDDLILLLREHNIFFYGAVCTILCTITIKGITFVRNIRKKHQRKQQESVRRRGVPAKRGKLARIGVVSENREGESANTGVASAKRKREISKKKGCISKDRGRISKNRSCISEGRKN